MEVVLGKNPCSWGIKYYSVIGFGEAYFLEGPEAKKEALNIVMRKFTKENQLDYPEEMLKKTEVIKVVIEEMTGKKSGY